MDSQEEQDWAAFVAKFQELGMQRLIDKIKRNLESGCWEWTACLENGYGRIRIAGKAWLATRYIMTQYVRVDEDMFCCHKCDNRRCVKPTHLFIGSHADNMRDMAAKDRAAKSHLTVAQAKLAMDLIRSGIAARVVALMFDVPPQAIHRIRQGASKVGLVGDLPEAIRWNVRGENVNTAKLTVEHVLEIRALSRAGYSAAKIAKMFGVGKSAIEKIYTRRTWAHVP